MPPETESQARENLLAAISKAAEHATQTAHILRLAEAYAWVVRPDRGHP